MRWRATLLKGTGGAAYGRTVFEYEYFLIEKDLRVINRKSFLVLFGQLTRVRY